MKVIWNNKKWNLDMPWRLFQSIRERNPTYEVDLIELTTSTYKEIAKAMIKEVQDVSIL